jgi:regulator of RNase E activity RraA
VPIEIDGVRVNTGDVIFGDRDGVLVVPADAVEAAFTGAFEKARTENQVLKALQAGMSTVEAFKTFGVM